MLRLLSASICVFTLPGLLCAQICAPPTDFEEVVKAPIGRVRFSNDDNVLSKDKQLQIVKELRQATRAAWSKLDISNLADEAAERVRAAYQNEGYFKVQVEAGAQQDASGQAGSYDIVIRTTSLGLQYRLGSVNIIKATHFSAQQLRDLFPIQRGEIFSREKIAEGLEELRRFYGSQGYINSTAVPDTEFDDDKATVDITVDIDEGKQFRVRSIDVLGVDPNAKSRVLGLLDIKPGDAYSSAAWVQSLRQFPNVAPNDPRVVQTRVDEREGLVDVVLDFSASPFCSVGGDALPSE